MITRKGILKLKNKSFKVASGGEASDAANLRPVGNLIELQNAVTLLNEYRTLIKQLQNKSEFLEAVKKHQRNELTLIKLENNNLKRTVAGLRRLAELNVQEIVNQKEETQKLEGYQKLVRELGGSLRTHDELFNTTEELIKATQGSYKELLELVSKKLDTNR